MSNGIQYKEPDCWIYYDTEAVHKSLANATTSLKVLKMIPFQRRWAEELQNVQLKMEISGTSQIEGAEFVGDEFDAALRAATHTALVTRSQKQAHSALKVYEWIARVPDDRPISLGLIEAIQYLVVKGCDDDHCVPGELRKTGQNVTFGIPRHRGVEGGSACKQAIERLAHEAATTFRSHDALIQAIAIHYHLAAMHPFLDGNGRTARAVEALMLQRAGLRGTVFIPMSNYYNRAQDLYLSKLAETRHKSHDLTSFLIFALRGIESESSRLAQTLAQAVSKGIFQNFLNELRVTLARTRKRVIVRRQLMLLGHLLDRNQWVDIPSLATKLRDHYQTRKDPVAALRRDLARLEALGAVLLGPDPADLGRGVVAKVNLDWPKSMTASTFLQLVNELPKRTRKSLLSA